MKDRLRELKTFPYFVGVWACGMVGAFVGTTIGEVSNGESTHWTAPSLIGKVIGPTFAVAAGVTGARKRKRDRRRTGCRAGDAEN